MRYYPSLISGIYGHARPLPHMVYASQSVRSGNVRCTARRAVQRDTQRDLLQRQQIVHGGTKDAVEDSARGPPRADHCAGSSA